MAPSYVRRKSKEVPEIESIESPLKQERKLSLLPPTLLYGGDKGYVGWERLA